MRSQAKFHKVLVAWFDEHGRTFPWRNMRDPYSVLLGEVLLQRTRGENAVAAYKEFIRRWPTPSALAGADEETIQSVILSLGLRKRTSLLLRLGTVLAAKSSFPIKPSELLELPGVGRYAAHAVPVFARNRNLPVVDWVIARVLRRYFGLDSARRPNSDEELWTLAQNLASRGNARRLWLGTLDFAAAVCKPKPLCELCPLRNECAYRQYDPSHVSSPD